MKHDDRGHVRVHKLNGTDWNQVGDDIGGEDFRELFGGSVAINEDGTVVAIGAPYVSCLFSLGLLVSFFQLILTRWTCPFVLLVSSLLFLL